MGNHMAKRQESQPLLLIRSGRTEWAEQGRLQGHADLPIADAGRAAVVATRSHLLSDENAIHLATNSCAPDEATPEPAALLAYYPPPRSDRPAHRVLGGLAPAWPLTAARAYWVIFSWPFVYGLVLGMGLRRPPWQRQPRTTPGR